MTECGCSEICRLNGWTDQFQSATRELMVFTKNPKRYFDVDAVRQPLADSPGNRYTRKSSNWEQGTGQGGRGDKPIPPNQYSAGAPPLDWWQIPSPKPQPVTEGDPMTATFYVGDAIETMNKLPEKSVDLILTSPPFLALRSYLPADHPDKALEGGSQATPGEYIDWLIDVVEACDRVLAPHGSMAIELGDTYSGSGGAGGDYAENGLREGQPTFRQGKGTWPLPKSLSLIPELFRLTLVYGTNPLTGRTTERWRLRNVVRWVRPNPPVGALGDKFRPATSELMVFCKSAKRYFDLDAVREPVLHPAQAAYDARMGPTRGFKEAVPTGTHARPKTGGGNFGANPAGAPPLDWWNIPPGGFSGAHYAVFPPELCIKPIKAMSPERVCRQCGEPSRRIVGDPEYVRGPNWRGEGRNKPSHAGDLTVNEDGDNAKNASWQIHASVIRTAPTLGFSDCGHDDWRPGLVLDPFGGSGTTALVATGHGRDCILIDLDERNFDLALQRVGPFILERAR